VRVILGLVDFMRDVLVEIWFASCVTLRAQPLIDYLRQLQAQGETHVNVDDDARVFLREFYKRAMGRSTHSVPQRSQPVASNQQCEVTEVPARSAEGSAQPSASDNAGATALSVEGGKVEEKLASLKQQAVDWAPAKSLGSFRQTLVFSTGNPRADIMLIGEAPGFDEERLREPFVGKAGQKLDAILKAMGTERAQVYISNIVKFRPSMPNQTTSNRKPTAAELSAWLPFIREEVKMVAPKVIVALGGTAAQALLESQQSVGEMRGEFHRYEGVPLRVTYHPSYILTEGQTPEKRMLWEDMLSVMELLGMPISEKQRGYFRKKS
jgi:DNA polymerase